jgi:flagellar motility protein MotE (MotC chaperone)
MDPHPARARIRRHRVPAEHDLRTAPSDRVRHRDRPDARIAELRRQRQRIDDQIERIEAGEVDLLDSSAVRDRYQQFANTARDLLADFREVEENFRKLDRRLREKIAGWQGGKGELLDDVLGSRESISGSDQHEKDDRNRIDDRSRYVLGWSNERRSRH